MPSISFVQSNGVASAPGLSPALAFGSNVLAGSLLVAYYSSLDSPSANLDASLVLTDSTGGTWRQYGATAFDPSVSGSWIRQFYCLTAIGGATTVTATCVNASGAQCALVIAEFTKPSTLIPFAVEQRNINSPSPGNVLTPTLTLPGPGLMVAAYESNRTDMAIDPGTFTALPDQLATGCNIVWAYALNPQLATRCSWTKTAALTTRGGNQIMAFLDSAGFAARPKPLGGKGASW
jgi:hypothetical protein